MKTEVLTRITIAIENHPSPENLSLRDIAAISFVSPATVSRYIRQSGYKDFNEFKLELITTRVINNSQNIKLDLWIKHFSSQVGAFQPHISKTIQLLTDKKILLYYCQDYQYIASNFLMFVTKLNLKIQIINESSNLEQFDPQYYCIFAVGNLPTSLYNEQFDYSLISYQHIDHYPLKLNIIQLAMIPRQYAYNHINILNYRISFVSLLLSHIVDQLYIFLNRQQIDNYFNFN